jgi:hypothetical protein
VNDIQAFSFPAEEANHLTNFDRKNIAVCFELGNLFPTISSIGLVFLAFLLRVSSPALTHFHT